MELMLEATPLKLLHGELEEQLLGVDQRDLIMKQPREQGWWLDYHATLLPT